MKKDIKEFVKKKIELVIHPVKLLTYGSTNNRENTDEELNGENIKARDFDIAVIVSDTENIYELVKSLRSIMKDVIIEYGIMVNITPIHESVFLHGKSEFLDNVRKTGMGL